MLQIKIYKKTGVAPAAWIRVNYPHFANIGLTDVQMLKIARAEGCGFEEEAFRGAIRRFRRAGGLRRFSGPRSLWPGGSRRGPPGHPR